jgi:Ni/Co efflux regulator RcnB
MRRPIIAGLAAAAAAAAGAQPGRPPDAHDRGPPRTDAIDVGPVIAPDHYVPPVSGWRYRPLGSGERLAAAFYAERYRIPDPRRFNLRRPSGSLRWIRYGDDLVLVNLASGRVQRVIREGYRRG